MPTPIKTYTYFDGKALESYGLVIERIEEGIPPMREELEPKAGRDGSYLKSLNIDSREIVLSCRAFADTWQGFEDLKATIAAKLVTTTDKKLVLRTHPSEYYMAHYVSFSEGERVGGTGIAEFELTFRATDPLRYGASRSMVVKPGETKTLTVGGTHAADLVISSTNARRGTGNVWGVKIDGETVKVPLPAAGAFTVRIDCVNRTVKVNKTASMITLDSDWPTLSPGNRKASIDIGSGNATLSWIQRHV